MDNPSQLNLGFVNNSLNEIYKYKDIGSINGVVLTSSDGGFCTLTVYGIYRHFHTVVNLANISMGVYSLSKSLELKTFIKNNLLTLLV